MKKIYISLIMVMFFSFSMAQEIELIFSPANEEYIIDSIFIKNQRSGQQLQLLGNETLILNKIPTELNNINDSSDDGLLYPNPSNGVSYLNYVSSSVGKFELKVFNSMGNLEGSYSNTLQPGNHQFHINFPVNGFYIIATKRGNEVKNFKAINLSNDKQELQINYLGMKGYASEKSVLIKESNLGIPMDFWEDDILHFTFYSGNMVTVMTESPSSSRDILVDFHTCTDLENRHYKTVSIGRQTWMAENLAYLPTVNPGTSYSNTEPQYYVYGYNGSDVSEAKRSENFKRSGVLYNWSAATNGALGNNNQNIIQGVCPSGWHLPSDEEWKELEVSLGMNQGQIDRTGWRGTDQANKLKEITGWFGNGNGNNMFAFSALPTGYLNSSHAFTSIGSETFWWSSTDNNNQEAINRNLINNGQTIGRNYKIKADGHSIRCIKDSEKNNYALMQNTDLEGNSYFMLDTLDLCIKFQALDTLSQPMSNINIVCHKLQNYVIFYVNESLKEPWFRIFTYDELSELQSAESLKSTNQPTIAVTAIIATGLTIWAIYDFIKEMVTDPPRIDEVQNDGYLVKKCLVGDWNDVIKTAGLIGGLSKGVKAIRVFGAPAKLRGVTAINLGFTYKKLTQKTIEQAATSAATELGPLDKDRTVICWYEQIGGGIESAIPILYVEDKSEPSLPITDSRDDKVYKTVKIGNQTWMAENLKYSSLESFCYDNNPLNEDIYGRLYPWIVAKNSCPTGWHLPSDNEWKELEVSLGMSQSEADIDGSYRGTDEGGMLKAVDNLWIEPNFGANNSSRFSALPGGCGWQQGNFVQIGTNAWFWTSNEENSSNGWCRALSYNYSKIARGGTLKGCGMSIRCIKD